MTLAYAVAYARVICMGSDHSPFPRFAGVWPRQHRRHHEATVHAAWQDESASKCKNDFKEKALTLKDEPSSACGAATDSRARKLRQLAKNTIMKFFTTFFFLWTTHSPSNTAPYSLFDTRNPYRSASRQCDRQGRKDICSAWASPRR